MPENQFRDEMTQIELARSGAILQIGMWPGREDELAAELRSSLQLDLPTCGQLAVGVDGLNGYRIAPDRFLFVDTRKNENQEALDFALPREIGVLCELGAAKKLIWLRGTKTSALLSQIMPFDFESADWVDGRFAQTGLHDANILIHRIASSHYLMLAPTSFAQSLQEYIVSVRSLMHY